MIKLLPAVREGFALSCEVLVLFVSLFVDMRKLLLRLRGFGQLSADLILLFLLAISLSVAVD